MIESQKIETIAMWALKGLLGCGFLIIGVAKLTSSLETVQLFAAIGWGQWFRYFTGLVDVVGALMLFIPRCTKYGALLLLSSIGLAAVLDVALLHQNPAVPMLLTFLTVVLAWLAWTRPLRRNPASAANANLG